MQKHVTDTAGAFIETFVVEGAGSGPLSGLTFGAKDLYDVAGHVTGCGSPDWARTHDSAKADSPAVAMLLAAGATLVGKTHTDELAYSLMGVNAHYGTPLNTAAPDRVPGGSSSGSVAAVAAGLVDIGLGSDTGGSVRMPASFCGVWGIRTTHGSVPISGAMPLALSFDTVGWFARDAGTMAKVCEAYRLPAVGRARVSLLLPVDAWARATPETVDALAATLAALEAAHGPARPVVLAPDGLDSWRETFRVIQAGEIWQTHGAWVTATDPAFGPGIRERFAMAAAISNDERKEAEARRGPIRERVRSLAETGLLVLPASPGPAPLRTADGATLDRFRAGALELLCPAGLAGLPQLTMPGGTAGGAPVGLSLVGPPGSEAALIAAASASA